jgi:penicillin amidase
LKALWPDFQRHQGPTAQALLKWDGRMDAGRSEPHLFVRLIEELRQEVGFDEAVRARIDATPITVDRLLRLLVGGLDEVWWDDVGSQSVETRAEIIDRCLDRLDALTEVRPWGAVHSARFVHPLVDMPLIGLLFRKTGETERFPFAGDGGTLDTNSWEDPGTFDVVSMPSMRLVADLADWDRTVLMLPTGQSARLWSTNSGVRIQAWNHGGPQELPFSRAAVESSARARLVMIAEDRGQ